MVKNILAFIFSCVLIDFDRKFMDGSGWGSLGVSVAGSCNSYSGSNLSQSPPDWLGILGPLVKGQLAGSVIILVSALVFIGIYIYVYIRAVLDNRDIYNNPVHHGVPSQYQQQPIIIGSNITPFDGRSKMIRCPNCGTALDTVERL